jgi:hypothetical protein
MVTKTKAPSRTTRTARAAKAVVAPKVVAADPIVERSTDDTPIWHGLFGKLPDVSWKRTICGYIATTLTGAGLGYLGGLVLGALMVGAYVLTASSFLALAIYFIGMIALAYAGYKAGGPVFAYVVTGKIDEHFNLAKSKVLGLFNRTPERALA